MEQRIENSEVFRLTDDQSAEWAVRKIREARRDTEQWEAHFAGQMERIRKANEETEAYFTTLLAEWFAIQPKRETKDAGEIQPARRRSGTQEAAARVHQGRQDPCGVPPHERYGRVCGAGAKAKMGGAEEAVRHRPGRRRGGHGNRRCAGGREGRGEAGQV